MKLNEQERINSRKLTWYRLILTFSSSLSILPLRLYHKLRSSRFRSWIVSRFLSYVLRWSSFRRMIVNGVTRFDRVDLLDEIVEDGVMLAKFEEASFLE